VKKLLICSLLGVACASVSATPIAYGGHYYDIIAAPGITWQDANTAAFNSYYLGLEGHLVTITSGTEHSAVNTLIQAQGLGEMWAGGYQSPVTETNPQAGWTWVNNEGAFPGVNSTTPYASWNSGEPNDAYGSASEQYLGLNFGAGFNDEGNLNNIAGYVIEYDPNTVRPSVPDGGSSLAMLAGATALLTGAARRLRK
jgi:hypothetical protein